MLTIEPTSRIVDIVTEQGTIPARVWQGKTDSGIEVAVLVTRVATHRDNDMTEFDRTLLPQPPGAVAVEAFPNRMIL
jgi:hypothetical protein